MKAPEGGREHAVDRSENDPMGCDLRVSTIPDNGLQGHLEADLHIQWIGTLEVNLEDFVSNDEIVDQGEGVFIDDMSSIPL